MSATSSEEPAVSGVIFAHVRRSLEEVDLYGPAWRALRRRNPDYAAALTRASGTSAMEWVPAAAYAALLSETAVIAGGTDRLRAMGLRWSKKELAPGGRFGAMRRSWLRAFGGGPAEVARLAPHVWRAAMRRNGRVRHADSGEGFVRLVLESAPIVRRTPAWQKSLEGALQGLLELSTPQASVQVAPSAVDPEAVDALVLWRVR